MAQALPEHAALSRSLPVEYGWFVAGVGSWFGAWGMQSVLFSWLVVGELRADPHLMAFAQTALMVPGLVFLLLGGALADRVDRRRLLMRLHVVGGALAFALAAVVGAHQLSIVILIGYALGIGTAGALLMPARDALLSEVAGGNIMRAVTGLTLIQFSMQALGALAGGSARWLGSAPALALQGIVVLAGVLALRRLPAAAPAVNSGARAATHVEIREGLREVWRSPRLRPPVLLVVWNGLLFMGPFLVVFPILVRDFYHGDVGQLGLVNMSFPLGTISGSVVLLLRGGIRRKGRALLIALFCGGLCLASVSLGVPFAAFLAVVFVWGLSAAVAFNTSRTLVQEAAPPTHRARVLSIYSLGFVGAAPLGAFAAGFAADLVGPFAACALPGLSMLIVALLAWSFSAIRHME